MDDNSANSANSWDTDEPTSCDGNSLTWLLDLKPYAEMDDKKGHSVHVTTRIPKKLSHWIDQLRESPGSPYTTRSEYLRDAVFIGTQVIALRQKQSSCMLEATLSAARARIYWRTQVHKRCDEIVESISVLLSYNDDAKAQEFLQEFIDWAKQTDDSDDYLEALRTKLTPEKFTSLRDMID